MIETSLFVTLAITVLFADAGGLQHATSTAESFKFNVLRYRKAITQKQCLSPQWGRIKRGGGFVKALFCGSLDTFCRQKVSPRRKAKLSVSPAIPSPSGEKKDLLLIKTLPTMAEKKNMLAIRAMPDDIGGLMQSHSTAETFKFNVLRHRKPSHKRSALLHNGGESKEGAAL